MGSWGTPGKPAAAARQSARMHLMGPGARPILRRPRVTVLQGKEDRTMSLRPGLAAPDFEAQALIGGDFEKVKLSSFRGRWVALFFYPADFTFV